MVLIEGSAVSEWKKCQLNHVCCVVARSETAPVGTVTGELLARDSVGEGFCCD
jgi:hypothetical protein